jgi:hypothetical protein
MSVLNDTWGYLVQRKLWPLAVLLIAALVAVPMMLAKDPEPAAAPVGNTKSSQSQLATEPIVALAGPGDRAERRRVLGSRKNPFTPAELPKKAKVPKVVDPAAATTDPATGGADPGGQAPDIGATPVTPGDTTPQKTFELFELSVRFGVSSDTGDLPKSNVKRLEALPSAEEPVLVYLGVLSDKKTAVFLVDAGVVAQGDGKCMPSRTSCETIHLKAGETEFFDVVGEEGESASGQFQLDLVTVRRKKTTSAKAAKRSYARVSAAGQKIVRARVAGDGPLRFRYDAKTGRLHKLTTKAYKAAVSRAAHVARAHL